MGVYYFRGTLVFINKQYTMGKFIITESEKNNIRLQYGIIKESDEIDLIKTELFDSGVSIPVEKMIDSTEPLCTSPETGDPMEDSVLSKVWEWAQSQSVETLKDMKSKIRESINVAKTLIKNKRVDEQSAPILIIGGIGLSASMLIAVGALLIFIVAVAIVSRSSKRKSPCQRRRKLTKRYGIDGNFM